MAAFAFNFVIDEKADAEATSDRNFKLAADCDGDKSRDEATNDDDDNDEESLKTQRGSQTDLETVSNNDSRGTNPGDVDGVEEPRKKKAKMSRDDDDLSKNQSCLRYEKLSWKDMIEECLHDTEIESIVIRGSPKDVRLFSLHPSLVETKILSLNEDGVSADDSIARAAERRSDLVPRVYEGGLKIWECSLDLVRFLRENIDEKLFPPTKTAGGGSRTLRVLELGCGAGLPGIWALRHPSVAEVHFQDYNRRVVLGFTMPNVVVNEGEEGEFRDSCHFHCGDWSAMVKECKEEESKFDLILASETIYRLEDSAKFRDAVAHFLRPDGGVALVAAKEYYFGVGGGVHAFLDEVAKGEKTMKCETNWIEQHGVRRAIIELRF